MSLDQFPPQYGFSLLRRLFRLSRRLPHPCHIRPLLDHHPALLFVNVDVAIRYVSVLFICHGGENLAESQRTDHMGYPERMIDGVLTHARIVRPGRPTILGLIVQTGRGRHSQWRLRCYRFRLPAGHPDLGFLERVKVSESALQAARQMGPRAAGPAGRYHPARPAGLSLDQSFGAPVPTMDFTFSPIPAVSALSSKLTSVTVRA